MQQYGIDNVKTRRHDIAFHADPAVKVAWVEDVQHAFRTIFPFIRKWVKFSDDYESLYQRMLQETQHPDFEASVTLLTAWGNSQTKGSRHKGLD
jgi:hypothetical protein